MLKVVRTTGLLVVGLGLTAWSGLAGAATMVSDQYIGGTPTCCAGSQNSDSSATGTYPGSDINDVLGNIDPFSIVGATIDRDGTSLTVRIDTEFAGAASPDNYADSGKRPLKTGYGSLFLGAGTLPFNTVAETANDTWLNDQDRFSHALYMEQYPTNAQFADGSGDVPTTDTNLYAIDANDVLVSNVVSGGYRAGQAWSIDTNTAEDVGAGFEGSYAVDMSGEYIQFVIKDIFDANGVNGLSALGNQIADANGNFVFGWAMSCANDVIYGTFNSGPLKAPPVPLPAGFILLLTGLLGVGWLGRSRAKQA